MKTKRNTLVVVGILLVAAATVASGQTAVVTVPGNALGGFGNPSSSSQQYITGLTVSGPGTFTVKYIDGTVTDCCPNVVIGPNGTAWNYTGLQSPLQEASGISGGMIYNADALIGTFVPESRVMSQGFAPVDGTKNITAVGIVPSGLFMIGSEKVIPTSQAGTLYLGINDCCGSSNGGSFTVKVTFVPAT